MKKIIGISVLLLVICLIAVSINPDFAGTGNVENILRWSALFAIISIGAAFVIITGGIDLSVGSVIGLTGCILALALTVSYEPVDRFEVLSVNAGARTITVTGDARTFEADDRIAFTAGHNADDAIFTVERARYRPDTSPADTTDADDDAQPQPATILEVREAPTDDDTAGNITRAHPVTSVDVGGERNTVILDDERSNLKPGDRLSVIRPELLPVEYTVLNVQPEDDRTVLRVEEDRAADQPLGATVRARRQAMSIPAALGLVVAVSLAIGLTHGLLITRLGLQPFVVTLCGLMIYRGLARSITGDQTVGFGSEFEGLKLLAKGSLFETFFGVDVALDIPMTFLIMAVIGILGAIFLNKTIWGRYLLALGRNEEAARFSGIRTGQMTILAYVICSLTAGIAGILFALDLNSISPAAQGEFYELYAIAAAVLGGCSLRGGEGSILGVIIGAAILRVLYNAINVLGMATQIEFAVVGLVILAGVITDELVKRWVARRRAVRQAAAQQSPPAETSA